MTNRPAQYAKWSVPTSFEEMYKMYSPVINNLGIQAGLSIEEREDATSYIMMRFFERDFLGSFDPNRGVKFSTYIIGSARLYMRHFFQKKIDLKVREGIDIAEALQKFDEGHLNSRSFYYDPISDIYSSLSPVVAFVESKCSEAEYSIFEAMLEATAESGRVTYIDVAKRCDLPYKEVKILVEAIKFIILEYYTAPESINAI